MEMPSSLFMKIQECVTGNVVLLSKNEGKTQSLSDRTFKISIG